MAAKVIPFRTPIANDNSDSTPPPASAAGNVVTLPVNPETPALRFERAYQEAAIARAEYDLHRARYLACLKLERQPNQPWQESPWASETPFETWRALTFKMAVTPATCRNDLAKKKSLIGRSWLNGTGEVFEAMRAAVKIDELRFGKRRAA